ncbi:MAG: dihydrodipicolinate synthase family protein, partial [Firmicutes bacterium]|nr:dihydrodipicolinate synthase family protein [Bacillota bacterium]
LYPALCVGATGGTLAVANIVPNECADILELHRAGDAAGARALQQRILEVNAAVTTRWGVAGLKAAMDMLGYYGGDPRPPLLPLEAESRSKLRAILERAGLL